MTSNAADEGKNDFLDRNKYRLDGYVVIITGGSAGIGKETARELALRGAEVLMANRDLEKSASVIAALKAEEGTEALPEGRISVKQLNLADLSSVRSFADEVKRKYAAIDILINNAGKMGGERIVTKDGYESQFQTNHLGHFLLTHLLMEKLLVSKHKPKVINLSSRAHESGRINLDDLQCEASYPANGFGAYANSKLMNVLFTKALAEKYAGKVNAYAVHPGVVKTELGRYSSLANAFYCICGCFAKDEDQGALTTVYCAVSAKAEQETGLYYADCKVCDSSKASRDMEMAQKLWEKSCQLLNITWNPWNINLRVDS